MGLTKLTIEPEMAKITEVECVKRKEEFRCFAIYPAQKNCPQTEKQFVSEFFSDYSTGKFR
jgi:hypothetical protein